MKNKYIVSCANWQLMSSGDSAEDASTRAFERMMEREGKKLKVSPVMETLCLSDVEEDFDLEQYKEFVFCPSIMANAGYHDSAKTFSTLIENEDI